MGSLESTVKSPSNVTFETHNDGNIYNDSKEDINAEEQEAKIVQQIKEEIENDNKKFKAILEAAQKSIEKDQSMPNLIDNYTKLRTMTQPKLKCIGSFVGEMKDGWAKIMAQLKVIRGYNKKGKEKADEMEAIHTDYWRLLLKTSSKIKILMTQCKIQKDNIADLLDILEEGNKGTLTGDDKLAYQDCINCLGKWIKADIIKGLIDDWKEMGERLGKARDGWAEIAKIATGQHLKETGWFIGKLVVGTLLVIGVIAAVTAIVVSTAGVGGCVIGVVAAETAVVGVSVKTAVIIAIVAGSAVAAGSTYFGVKAGLDYKSEAVKIRNGVNMLAKKLEGMFQSSKIMQKSLQDFKDAENAIDTYLGYMKDLNARRIMTRALTQLNIHLDEYIEQGSDVIGEIENAAKQYIETN